MDLVPRLALGIEGKIIEGIQNAVNWLVLGAPVYGGNSYRLRVIIPFVVGDDILGIPGP
jgi:hypothetical protein